MKKPRSRLWFFPTCLFIFFSIFLLVKFIFIFFFRAAYEPKFVFDFTPFYLFSGISSIHLLFLSLGVVLFDTFLHVRASKRRLLYSYIPTAVLLTGLGITMVSNEVTVEFLFHYIIFGLFILTVLIDHNLILTSQDTFAPTLERKPLAPPTENKPLGNLFKPGRKISMTSTKQVHQRSDTGLTAAQKDSYDVILRNIQSLFESLERRTLKLEQAEKEIMERRKYLAQQEEMFIDRLSYHLKSKERFDVNEKGRSPGTSSDERIYVPNTITNNLVIEDATERIAVVQRGVLRQVSNSFASFLGYSQSEVINKKLFVFFTPEGMKNLRLFCESKLRGVSLNSYQSVFLTKKYDQIRVQITVQPMTYHGDAAELLTIREIK